jgi:PAS domain S-box-containing protein
MSLPVESLLSEGHARQIIAQLAEGFVSLDANSRLIECNAAAARLLDRTREELTGRNFFEAAGLGSESAFAQLTRQVMTRHAQEDAELSYEADHGRMRIVAVHAFPLGEGVAAIWRDITAARQAERRLAQSKAQYREVADGIPAAAWMSRPSGKLEYINHAMAQALGRPRRELLGDGWLASVDPQDLPRLLQTRAEARATYGSVHGEVRFRRPDGSVRILALLGHPRFDAKGKFCGHVGIMSDVTEAREAERRQQLLINELNHRVKNTLSTVQSLVRLTLRDFKLPDEVEQAVTERLMALSGAHDVLSREKWQDAELTDLVDEVTRPYAETGRISVSGPHVRISPRTAIALGMALHELTTNAVKHGALSNDEGRVGLSWTRKDGAIDLQWRERGGPRVGPPRLSGFGSRLLSRGLAGELGRSAELTYAPEGLSCQISAPAESAPADGAQAHHA